MSKRKLDDEENSLEDAEGKDKTKDVVNGVNSVVICDTPPCNRNPKHFSNYSEYELHFISSHNYICNECRKRFPSELFLELHIDENHNPFTKIEQDKGGKIFKCFNYSPTGCTKKCSTPKKRRLHMIDKHGYPKEFRFDIVNRGL
ncbi:uncharacterized protein RJT20DRAFT_126246 [Scheffersomyces xylosifermentans]|uniref:uncharacterized protein n=1 Tax=Scheffersomyces xylosifermentans TaxID=1304137 RepID=UPI00315C8C94